MNRKGNHRDDCDGNDKDDWEQQHLSMDSSDCEHEDSSDDDDSSNEEDDSSWLQDFRQAWKQHFLAILVAVLATAATHSSSLLYQQQQQPPSVATQESTTTPRRSSWAAPSQVVPYVEEAPSLDRVDHFYPHEHLEDYARTANVSFCGLQASSGAHYSSNRLAVMDFFLPKDLMPAMELHFVADTTQDDDYRTTILVLEEDDAGVDSSTRQQQQQQARQHPQIQCMQQLKENSPQTFIRGLTFYAKEPTIESIYPDHLSTTTTPHNTEKNSVMKKKPKKLEAAHLSFTGFAAKFVNLSPKPIHLYWDGKGGHRSSRRLVGEILPFDSLGTATTPGQSFYVSPTYDADHALERWLLTADAALVYYDPLPHARLERQLLLSPAQEWQYQLQKLNQEFAKHYLIASGRTWLSNFPRAFSLHPMWEASWIGQQHVVANPFFPDNGPRQFHLTVESVSPKVFTIPNFLSHDECDALIAAALQEGLQASTVYSGGGGAGRQQQPPKQRDTTTRSSHNTWLTRDTTTLTDRLYQRAAPVLKLQDESLLQKPVGDDIQAAHHSIAESLQVIRYQEGEEYTAHHDFVYPPPLHRYQPTRFATLLLYLNDDYTGGETVFPRAVTKDRHDGVRVHPEKGMAVLFYSVLEDGNVDDRSQHASEPVRSGEKVRLVVVVCLFVCCCSTLVCVQLFFVFRDHRSHAATVCCESLAMGASDQLRETLFGR